MRMMQPTLDTLLRPWLRMPAWAAVMSCLAAAERAFPVLDRLASLRTKGYCRESLDEAWAALTGTPLRAEEVSVRIRGIQGLPESSEDDSHKNTYYAMRGIGIVWHAVGAQLPDAAHQEWRSILSGMLSLAADLDFVTRPMARNKFSLKESEVAFQTQILRLVEGESGPSAQLVGSLRAMGTQMSAEY